MTVPGPSSIRPKLHSFSPRGKAMRASIFALVALAIDVTHSTAVRAETFNVPCDLSELQDVIQAVNTNGQEDFVWLAPSCFYSLLFATWDVAADGGNPVWIFGRGTTIRGNHARRVFNVSTGATLHLNGVTVADGIATTGNGGGILNGGTLTLTDSTVTANGAPEGYGGGIDNTGTLRVTRSTVSGNTAALVGGGIDNAAGGRLTLTESTVSGNSSLYGGGIRNRASAALFNSTLFGNGGFEGGGLLNEPSATATVGNVTFSGNETSGSDGGGGIRNEGALELDNTIIAGTRQSGHDCFNNGTIAPSGGNLVEDGSCSIPGALSGDPMLFGLAGGRPAYIPLLPGSAAIDAGSNSSCPGVDQRGFPRPHDGARDGTTVCDLGAYESACGLLGIELFLVLPIARGLARARRSWASA